MAQGKLVVVKRQVKDQIWYEAVDLQKLTMEQIHEISKINGRSGTHQRDTGQSS